MWCFAEAASTSSAWTTWSGVSPTTSSSTKRTKSPAVRRAAARARLRLRLVSIWARRFAAGCVKVVHSRPALRNSLCSRSAATRATSAPPSHTSSRIAGAFASWLQISRSGQPRRSAAATAQVSTGEERETGTMTRPFRGNSEPLAARRGLLEGCQQVPVRIADDVFSGAVASAALHARPPGRWMDGLSCRAQSCKRVRRVPTPCPRSGTGLTSWRTAPARIRSSEPSYLVGEDAGPVPGRARSRFHRSMSRRNVRV